MRFSAQIKPNSITDKTWRFQKHSTGVISAVAFTDTDSVFTSDSTDLTPDEVVRLQNFPDVQLITIGT